MTVVAYHLWMTAGRGADIFRIGTNLAVSSHLGKTTGAECGSTHDQPPRIPEADVRATLFLRGIVARRGPRLRPGSMAHAHHHRGGPVSAGRRSRLRGAPPRR